MTAVSFAIEGLSVPWTGAEVPDPRLLVLNEPLALELGLDPDALRAPEGVARLAGDGVEGAALAYAGHQFGAFVPRLGDGRALLLGEVVDTHGRRRDLHLKGSGQTPFARGGDGKAAVGPMLREYLMGEAMHALGIPTTRALAVVATGETVRREVPLPGAVLTRVAASHIRVGTFQYATADPERLRRLADYTIARHYPGADHLTFYERVVEAQAQLIAQWMHVGFIHGVMNTDNMAISGETIDYGPCAFMDAYDPDTVYSSIDFAGRYAYGNQPQIAHWNLARFAETLLPLLGVDELSEVLATFPDRYERHWRAGMRAKLGLRGAEAGDAELIDDFLALLQAQRVDLTSAFRAPARELFPEPEAFDAWERRRRARRDPDAATDAVNPVYIPRNHLVEEALAAATAGDLAPFERLLDALTRPYEARPGLEAYAQPAETNFSRSYRTFCGT